MCVGISWLFMSTTSQMPASFSTLLGLLSTSQRKSYSTRETTQNIAKNVIFYTDIIGQQLRSRPEGRIYASDWDATRPLPHPESHQKWRHGGGLPSRGYTPPAPGRHQSCPE